MSALALAAGYRRLVLVQPGSPARGLPASRVQAHRVAEAPLPAVSPGGNYFDNDSMLAYLLAVLPEAEAGHYLTQANDDPPGFSAVSFGQTIDELAR